MKLGSKTIIYSERGVSILFDVTTAKSLGSWCPISDRVVVAKLVPKPLTLGIIQVYAPKYDSEDVEVERFYDSEDVEVERFYDSEDVEVERFYNSEYVEVEKFYDSEDVEVEKFYGEIEKAKGYLKSQDIIIVMGYFNAKVGNERIEDIVGPSGIGTVKERESRLIE
ncbi:craniofacial development protein 2 [Plakobranchus ocellatus]|uniref:Craniofacial development protein 2 n=1 Tax=Plakobranchus ocellatus TaxID=259542 RepID=A0AAV3YWH6_9GAST|nr:craniofacial development protein 2 [Plakobranchus ocellatus]